MVNEKMNIKQLLEKYHEEETRVSINGIPDAGGGGITPDQLGIISAMEEDYLTLTIITKAEKQENTTKEMIHMPYNQIWSITECTKKAATLASIKAQKGAQKGEEEQKEELEEKEMN